MDQYFITYNLNSVWSYMYLQIFHNIEFIFKKFIKCNNYYNNFNFYQFQNVNHLNFLQNLKMPFTSGGPPKKIVPCFLTMMLSSAMAGT